MPSDVRLDFLEAAEIVALSPRGACALLRLGLQKLCIHLGQPGDNINADIAALVKERRISPEVQKAMDALRIVGNNAVHPGEMDIADDRALAEQLFGWVNFICDEAIAKPSALEALYASLPENARKAVEKRDTPKDPKPKTDST
jgi:hypothetical protein